MKLQLMVMTSLAVALAACNDAGGNAESPSASTDVSVAASGAAKVHAGTTATFTGTVTNAGPNAAQNLTIQHSLTTGYTVGTIMCTAAGGAACPVNTGASMDVATLPAGGSLTFSIPVTTTAAARGAIASTLQVTVAGDPVSANNSASATTVAEDARNDGYKAYATDGRVYTFAVDFDARTYSMTGNGLSASGTFAQDASATTFTFSGNARFRVAEDLLVGGFDFGGGVMPFVAGRRFVTAISELSGEFNNFGLDFSPVGTAISRLFASRFSSGVLQECPFDQIRFSVCTAGLSSYALSSSGDEIAGFDSVRNDTMRFRVAKSGGKLIVLRAEEAADGSGRRFRVGLPDTVGIAGGTFVGNSTAGEAVTAVITATTYNVTGTSAGGSPISESVPHASPGASSPQGVHFGTRTSDGVRMVVVQNDPIAALVGSRFGPATGYIQIGAP